jgi:hypothetical protein
MRDPELHGSTGIVRRKETRAHNAVAGQQPYSRIGCVTQYADVAQPFSVPVGMPKALCHVARTVRHVEQRLLCHLMVATVVRRQNLRSIYIIRNVRS